MAKAMYSEEFRSSVVAAFCEADTKFPSTSSAAEWVAREHGISRDSVRRWATEAGVWEAHNSAKLRSLLAENALLREQLERQVP
ncbi:transposase [Rhodococcus sp. IEGM 1408]|uniref:transposase n=1 Tax=Rhodococcus sp. IEGM 1408 TaxID=3082220 RepID=UPI002954D9BE|nr:transposase [Rhodococcus sp. IEGM 1408]MDV8002842.1 transposase [Rhodococcus sp. IEGM 1408]